MEFGFDRLPTDQREGGREGGKFTVASSPPATPRPRPPSLPPSPAHPLPALFSLPNLGSIGDRNSVGKRSFGHKNCVDETIYGVVKRGGIMICAISVCHHKI